MTRVVRTVALVGPDGAGKSAVVRAVAARLPVKARVVYLGVNLEASTTMLPTTRAVLALKRRRGGRADMTARFSDREQAGRRGVAGALRTWLRLGAWVAEEWYRAAVVGLLVRRGFLVLCDRHFFCDYYAADVAPRPGRSRASRAHGWMLRTLYPRPDLVVVLDAPAEVLLRRKGEDTLESLERRRQEYLALRDVLPDVVVVDATTPLDAVVSTVTDAVTDRLGRGASTPAGQAAPADPGLPAQEAGR
jgi:thymidylate kinase